MIQHRPLWLPCSLSLSRQVVPNHPPLPEESLQALAADAANTLGLSTNQPQHQHQQQASAADMVPTGEAGSPTEPTPTQHPRHPAPWSSFKATLAQPAVLPPASLCVLTLPFVYSAPLLALGPSLGLQPGSAAAQAVAQAEAQAGAEGGQRQGQGPAALCPVFTSLVEGRLVENTAVYPRMFVAGQA